MKHTLLTLAAFAALSLTAQPRTETQLEENWRFSKGDFSGAESPSFDDSKWESVKVPHDWAIYGPFDKEIDKQVVAIEQNGEKIASEKTGRTGSLPYIGVGWYRTSFTSPEKGKIATLIFDGAMSEPTVYVNGQKAGEWKYGYSSFLIDATPFLKPAGEQNTLAVRLENHPQSSRWYPGAGLYRPVTLEVRDAQSIDTWGVKITTPVVRKDFARIAIENTLSGSVGKLLKTKTTIFSPKGDNIAVYEKTGVVEPDATIKIDATVNDPMLWSPETPNLYTAVTEVYEGGVLKDNVSTRFGIRSVEITSEGGFKLNGVTRKFKGVCLHHDLGPLGAALNKAALRRQVRILKDMGCDAIRTAHNMPSQWQMDIYDEMGMMVMAESFDEWKSAKCKNGYNRFFNEWLERDLTNLIVKNRNHASLVMWCIGNEVPEQSGRYGARVAKRLQDICHKLDPTRTVTCGMDRVDNAIKSNFAATIEIPGLNYRTHRYDAAYQALPQGLILGSETASTVSSRGVYKFPVVEGKNVTHSDFQSSSYDLEACSWSNIPEDDWILQDDEKWVIGEFVWTGFDYLGEPTPYDEMWPSRSSYFGICDLAGLPKDRFFLYRSRWNTTNTTLHVLPHWNWEGSEGKVTPVFCYTSLPSAELFVNGKSQGRVSKDLKSRENRYRLRWDSVRYEPGEIKIVAYDAAGKQVATKTIRTAEKPYAIELTPDRTTLDADGNDLSFVTAKIVDKRGNLCPNATNQLNFKVTGAGSYRAACNGDATSLELFHLPTMKAFSGMVVVVVESKKTPGEITLAVSGKGLKSSTVKLSSK